VLQQPSFAINLLYIQYINMARITSAALALLLCLSSPLASASTTLIDSTGALTRSPIPQSSIGTGIVAVLSSPGTPSFFLGDNEVTLSSQGSVSILSSPGATLAGTSPLSKGNGAAAAASVAGSIIVSGITESDLENGLDDTRHGHTLTAIFKQKILAGAAAGDEKVTLIITVPAESDAESVMSDVHAIFDTATAEIGSVVKFDDLYDLSVENVVSEADAQRVSRN
jgi:hypothetical protein